jgi:hypothetical protein
MFAFSFFFLTLTISLANPLDNVNLADACYHPFISDKPSLGHCCTTSNSSICSTLVTICSSGRDDITELSLCRLLCNTSSYPFCSNLPPDRHLSPFLIPIVVCLVFCLILTFRLEASRRRRLQKPIIFSPRRDILPNLINVSNFTVAGALDPSGSLFPHIWFNYPELGSFLSDVGHCELTASVLSSDPIWPTPSVSFENLIVRSWAPLAVNDISVTSLPVFSLNSNHPNRPLSTSAWSKRRKTFPSFRIIPRTVLPFRMFRLCN